jgi:hypothetical protein
MLEYARKLTKKKFNYDVDFLLNESIILKNLKEQLKLGKFL